MRNRFVVYSSFPFRAVVKLMELIDDDDDDDGTGEV